MILYIKKFIAVHFKSLYIILKYLQQRETYRLPSAFITDTYEETDVEQINKYKYYFGNEISKDEVAIKQKSILNNRHYTNINVLLQKSKLQQMCLILLNICNVKQLLIFESKSRCGNPAVGNMLPMYLYYDRDTFIDWIKHENISPLLECGRLIFIVGDINGIMRFFSNPETIIPFKAIGATDYNLKKLISNIILNRKKYEIEINKSINQYYDIKRKESSFKFNQYKILIVSSINTPTAVVANNIFKELKRQNIQCKLSEPECPLYCEFPRRDIAYYKPDIIINCGYDLHPEWLPQNVINIIFPNDYSGEVFESKTVAKLKTTDYLIIYYWRWKKFLQLKYSQEKVIPYNHGVDPDVFKEYILTQKEKTIYGCDICIVTNIYCDYKIQAKKYIYGLDYFTKTQKQKIYEIALLMYDNIYDGSLYYGEDMKKFLLEEMGKREIVCSSIVFDNLNNIFYVWLLRVAYKQIVAEWIIDSGFNNFKIYGIGWETIEKTKPYAMGHVKNGTELSKIYQASKIVVGENKLTMYIQRLAESLFSGTLYLAPFVPEDEDCMQYILNIFKEGRNLEVYHSRKQLEDLIRFYLEHEQERKVMIEAGKSRALETLTYQESVRSLLINLNDKLEKKLEVV